MRVPQAGSGPGHVSLLDLTIPSHLHLSREVRKAIAERTARRKRLKALTTGSIALATTIVVVLGFGFLWIRAERTVARAERDRAIAAEKEEATQRRTADEERNSAIAAREETERTNCELIYENYVSLIAVADARVRDGAFDKAEELLWKTPAHLRHWEWGYLMKQCQRDLLTLRGHTDAVDAVAFSPDGTLLASGGRDSTIRFWNPETGEQTRVIHEGVGNPYSIAFSPDGRRIAAGTTASIGVILDVPNAMVLQLLTGHSGHVYSTAFSPDGKRVATASADGTVRIWAPVTGKELMVLRGEHGGVFSVAFRPDGRRLASGNADGTVSIWNVRTGEKLKTLRVMADGALLALGFSPDGRFLAVGGSARAVWVWNTETWELHKRIGDHSASISCVRFSPDAQSIASSSSDRSIRLWDAEAGRQLCKLTGHGASVRGVAFSPDGKRVASAGVDGTVRLWATKPRADAAVKSIACPGKSKAALSRDERFAVVTFKKAHVVDLDTGTVVAEMEGHDDWIFDSDFSPDGKVLVTGSRDGSVKLWGVASGREVGALNGHEAGVIAVAFSPDGSRVLTTSLDHTATVWDSQSWTRLLTLTNPGGQFEDGVFTPDGQRVVTGSSSDHKVRVWDATTGEVLSAFESLGRVLCVTVSADGRLVVAGGTRKTIEVWDAASGDRLLECKGHGDLVQSIGFSPDGRRLVSSGRDRTAKVWGVRSGRELLTLRHAHVVYDVAFLRDGKRLMTMERGTLQIWSAYDWTLTREQLEQQKLERYREWLAENVSEPEPAGKP